MTLEYINFAYTEETCFLHSTGDSETEVELDCSTEIEEKPLQLWPCHIDQHFGRAVRWDVPCTLRRLRLTQGCRILWLHAP